MFPAAMSNSTSLSEEASVSSGTRVQDFGGLNHVVSTISPQQPQKIKKKRSLPGNPDPDAEVIALSPKTLLATNRFVCEICNKGFQRDQNLQLHRRGHNLPWKLKQRNSKEVKKRAYVCPEPTCVHHHPSRALGDLTGIKKHYCRKHGEKKWKCEKCSKIYAVQSDWKAHSKTCGTREYRCDCGTLFSRKDSFITHRAFCDALAEESARLSAANQLATATTNPATLALHHLPPQNNSTLSSLFPFSNPISFPTWDQPQNPNPNTAQNSLHVKPEALHFSSFFQEAPPPPQPKATLITSPFQNLPTTSIPHLSATALLQKAATVGATATQLNIAAAQLGRASQAVEYSGNSRVSFPPEFMGFAAGNLGMWQKNDRLTRDFLGLTGSDGSDGNGGVNVNVSMNVRDVLTYTGGVEQSLLKPQSFGFAEPASEAWGDC
ncbi:hypothetical protein SLEP1_g1020 [Rubroshorea leprosula]|uniref:C2H2-type domain-containing protein n=1 Tax=Rubroshorea leprosula TaxID=152421 RepID=A0AAV5HL78_9ROSI|nr:hypothetical protein SLEP1_g1020 [Rubroshorea leprosula]